MPGFRYIGAGQLIDLLSRADLIPSATDGPHDRSDLTLVVTEFGLAMAALEIDSISRRGSRWTVWVKDGDVPPDIIRLVETHLAGGLPVSNFSSGKLSVPAKLPPAPTVIEVKGSSSDFEYQFPAAPEFFVGRKELVRSIVADMRGRESGGSLVINAKSGWGKSSLALQLQKQVEKAGGLALVLDARTAERPDYVTAALVRLVLLAAERGILVLPSNPALSSLQSIVETLRASKWRSVHRPLLIAFDQFENVFRYDELTKEFRDLALLVREVPGPLTVGFSWKTDLVGWTEGHPYRWRDEMRDASRVEVLDPLGPREIETLLRRLEKQLGAKLNRDLRQRLREYSQGLPWLFKKLAGHVLGEVGRGITQDELTREGLNAQALFESDLDRLSPNEQALLRSIAQQAPVLVADLDVGVATSAILESLLHQRLIVQVGDRLDTYWDTFRDFLNTGRVQVEDSYVVRYAPLGASKLLRALIESNGRMSVTDAADRVGTTVTVIFNYARELRLFGILSTEPNYLVIESDLLGDPARAEDAIRLRVASALRRHKMFQLAMEELGQSETVALSDFAALLPEEFPAVEAKADSWLTYARSFAQWMEYAGIVHIDRDGFSQRADDDASPVVTLLSGALPVRVRNPFPSSNPGPALALVDHLISPSARPRPSDRAFRAAARDLVALGIAEQSTPGSLTLTGVGLGADGELELNGLRPLVERQRGIADAFALLERSPFATPHEVGLVIRDALGAEWSEESVKRSGKFARAWARTCGITTELRGK